MDYERLSPADARSQERWRGTAFARVQSGPNVGRIVTVLEFSESGCRLRDSAFPCEVGDSFHILFENVEPMVVDVRWKQGAFIGLSFRVRLAKPVIEALRRETEKPLAERMKRLMER